jgi:hypothetical protein
MITDRMKKWRRKRATKKKKKYNVKRMKNCKILLFYCLKISWNFCRIFCLNLCIKNFLYNFFLSLLQDTELLILGCLKWDVSCVTPLDFIDLFISRLPIINKMCTDIDPDKIRKHSQAFISLAVRGKFQV